MSRIQLAIPPSNLPRVVIVGGGFAGITLARELDGRPFQVVLFDRNNYHCFQPLLYQVATAGLEPDSIAFPLRKIFAGQRNFYFRMAEVLSVDATARRITTAIGELEWDYLVLATGSVTNHFGLAGLAESSAGLKSLDDALRMRSLILESFEASLLTREADEQEALMNFVIVGGGPTGVELAGALGELRRHVLPRDYPELDFRKMRIHIVEAGPRLLGGMSENASRHAEETLRNLDVMLRLGTSITSYDGTTAMLGTTGIRSRNLIWTAGVKGSPLAGLEGEADPKSGRYEVDEFCRLKGQERIFALGDGAALRCAEFPGGHPMMAPVAIQGARLLARNLDLLSTGKSPRPFRYDDRGSMATIGRNHAVADIAGRHYEGFFAWVLWLALHLVTLMGFRNKVVVFVNWVWNYLSYDRSTRLIVRPGGRLPRAE